MNYYYLKNTINTEKKIKAQITCKCSRCKLTLSYASPSLCLLCGCKDCREALIWGFKQGGNPPQILPQLLYIRSDIKKIQGLEFLRAFQIRENAKSTRVYCIKCFSILGVDHPGYKNNVFMFFKGFCHTNFDLDIKPSAAIYLKDFPEHLIYEIPDDVDKYWSFANKERERFFMIPEVSNSLREVMIPPEGITFQEMILKLPKIEILNLPQN